MYEILFAIFVIVAFVVWFFLKIHIPNVMSDRLLTPEERKARDEEVTREMSKW